MVGMLRIVRRVKQPSQNVLPLPFELGEDVAKKY